MRGKGHIQRNLDIILEKRNGCTVLSRLWDALNDDVPPDGNWQTQVDSCEGWLRTKRGIKRDVDNFVNKIRDINCIRYNGIL
jgi:hypothetical protein